MVQTTRLALSIALGLSSIAQGYVLKMRDSQGAVTAHEVRSSNLTAEEFLSSTLPVKFHSKERSIEERESACMAMSQESYYYQIVGNGNPHQNYKIGQVENTLISCPGDIATGHEHTFGWSIGGDISAGGKDIEFGSIGFSVGESDTQTVQQTFSCEGDMTEICAMHYTAVTAVTVEFFQQSKSCNIETTSSLGIGTVYLPNANGVGSTIARGANFGQRNIIQCRGQAAREIDFFCGPAGGPEWFDSNQYGPWGDNYMASLEPSDCFVPIEAMHFLV